VRDLSAGLSLVEIMVTLVLAAIVSSATFMFFAGQQRVYETQSKVLLIQQNLWSSMEAVSRYVRSTGSGMAGCVLPALFNDTASSTAGLLSNATPSPGPLTASLATRPTTGFRALDDTTSNMQWIPPLWIVNNSTSDTGVTPNTDILTVAFGNRSSGADIDVAIQTNVMLTTDLLNLAGTNSGNMFRAGEFVSLLTLPAWYYGTTTVTDRGCTLFQITSNPASTTQLIKAYARAPGMTADNARIWNPALSVPAMIPAGGYTAGGLAGVRNLGQLVWVRFYVGPDERGVPCLWMQRLDLPASGQGAPQILAEGIEDLQVSFACDTGTLGAVDLANPNGTLDEGHTDAEKQTDEWWNNTPSDTLPGLGTAGFCNLPQVIRITLVARSVVADDLIDAVLTSNTPINIEDHHYSSPTPDQFRRRIMSTSLFPRNARPTL
jgi:Tfp pilus assembly protein PilW